MVVVGVVCWVLVSPQDHPPQDCPLQETPPPQETPFPGPRPPPDRPPPDRLKFRAFFCPVPHNLNSFFPLLGVFSLDFGGVFECRDPQMCTFGLSGLLGETRALPKAEIGQSSSRPSSLGLIEKKWKVFSFSLVFFM